MKKLFPKNMHMKPHFCSSPLLHTLPQKRRKNTYTHIKGLAGKSVTYQQ